jgi:hypothetical protein
LNHDIERQALSSAILAAYDTLYPEYKNVDRTRAETRRLVLEAMEGLSLQSGIKQVLGTLVARYRSSADESEKSGLYQEMQTLGSAIEIIERENSRKSKGGN